MKPPPLTTVKETVVEVKKTWLSLVTGWTRPAPVPDLARKAAQEAKDREREA